MREVRHHTPLVHVFAVLAAAVGGGCGADSPSSPGSESSPSTLSAAFTVSPASPSVNESVAFTDRSTGGPTSWSWTFGDGGSSSVQHPTHTYAASGTYTVTLVASSARGSSTATNSIGVGATESRLGTILGRPTDVSIVASVLAPAGTEVYIEYGTAPGTYVGTTPVQTAPSSSPITFAIGALTGNTRYYYRARYRSATEADYRADTEHSFQTHRPPGSTFTFVVQADPHMDENSSAAVYTQALANELADRPDLLFDLGDTSMSEKCAIDATTTCVSPAPASAEKVWARNRLMRSFFETACHSIPLFMALGNHDGEAGWQDMRTEATSARKAFFVNPEPDGFYSGNTEGSPAGLLQDYYAFEWGDALFVVIDPFTYTTRKPSKGQEQESWNWTLGATQYQWLARTLAASRARHKFVFSHHLVGGNGSEARGGAAFADFYEWGGRNLDGTWAFDKQRPGWQAPIHKLLVDNRVTAWFHGHDHLYAVEQLDGVVYQEVPQPSLARYDQADPGNAYGYRGTVGETVFPSPGHLRVTVSPDEVRVDYVSSVAPGDETATRRNGAVVHRYVVR